MADDLALVEDGNYEFDLFVVGIGSGGTRASRIASQLGAKVGACELAYHPISSDTHGGIGGTCVLRGCVPKKILMYGSTFSGEFEDSKGFGWDISQPPTFNWNTLIENKTKEIERLNGIYKRLLTNAKVTLFEGFGKLVDEHTIEVTLSNGQKQIITTKYILIATGGRATLLDIPGKEYAITSDEALSLENFPKKITIVGGGYIAVEFAGIFNGLGAEVDLVYRSTDPLRGFDDEMRKIVALNLENRGIKLHPSANLKYIEKNLDGSFTIETDKNAKLHADICMFATGRKPNTKNLNLHSVGVKLDKHDAIIVNDYSQTNIKSIFAVGDVTNRINLTPVALMEGQCFAHTIFGNNPLKPSYQLVPSAVFCQPPLSVVGLTEQLAIDEADDDIIIFTSNFTPMKNTISGRKEKTYMKLIVDSKSDLVVGAAMCGPDAPEIMQSIAIAMKCGATKKQFDMTVGIHPSAAEEFVTMRTPSRRIPPNKPKA